VTIRIAVVGSLNHDLTVFVPHRPGKDETLHCQDMNEFRGGKGSNQAVAAARMGASVAMIGCVGDDARAEFLLDGLELDGVDHSYVTTVEAPTGLALITVDPEDVSIVLVSGANAFLDATYVRAAKSKIVEADALLLQGEVSAEASKEAALIAASAGTLVVYNPAPFTEAAKEIAVLADILVVNSFEAEQLGDADTNVVVKTLGAAGCEVSVGEEKTYIDAPAVSVVDPTGAGDAFLGAFAVSLIDVKDPVIAASIAVAAGSYSVTVAGAQPSFPTQDDIADLLKRKS